MERTEQARLVLEVLVQMKDCLDNDKTYTTIMGKPFNLTRKNGICWHVFAHTPNSEVTGIDLEYLQPVLAEMGLDELFPVEMQLSGNERQRACNLHFNQGNLFDMDSAPGKVRYKLLCDLIKYFTKVLAKPETVL